MIRTIFDFYSHEFTVEEGVIVAYFHSKTGTGYRVYFYPAKDYFDYLPDNGNIYKFGYYFGFTKVEPNEDKKEPIDFRVMNTITNIINEFYDSEGTNSILLFHCSDEWGADKKLKRANKFDYWFSEANTNYSFKKYNEEIVLNEIVGTGIIKDKEYLSLIIESNSPNINAVLEEFQQIKDYFVSSK